MSTSMNTVAGTWRAAPTPSRSYIDLEAQVVLGRREPIPYPTSPAPALTAAPHAPAYTNPIDDFFGVVPSRGTHDSRHDERRASFNGDAPPPYAPRDAQGLPSYSSIAEPPTLAMYLFRAGFLFPLFWLVGAFILLCPLSAPEGWESSKSAEEREELLVCLRRTELKWAKRCLVASSLLVLTIAAIVVLVTFVKRS